MLRTYLSWSFWVGVAFFGVYPTMNWVTSLRARPWHLYLPAELAIPFVPQFVWAYLSMYVLFALPLFVLPKERMPILGRQLIAGSLVSAALFLLLPAELGFPREVPAAAPYGAIFAGIFGVDRPYNLVPSLHVIFSTAIALACADVLRPPARAALLAWLAVIVASTVLVHQHHLIDVAAALAVVFVLRRSERWLRFSSLQPS
jgi:membrane-associated phospholipid phosphatase